MQNVLGRHCKQALGDTSETDKASAARTQPETALKALIYWQQGCDWLNLREESNGQGSSAMSCKGPSSIHQAEGALGAEQIC